MTTRTRSELNGDADTALADNSTRDISAADIRQRVKDLADSALLPEDLSTIDLDVFDDATSDHKFASAAEKTKLGHITVTQAVDLDAIETRVNALDAAVILKGTWDASAGSFPGGGSAQAGESWIVSVAGTVNSVAFAIGDRIIAITDNASTSTFAANWFKADYTDQVSSVAGRTGAVTLAQADVSGLTTSDSPQHAAIELGHASDTTLSRGAAGFLAVESKRVPSPASQASGDVLYRGSTEWERLAKGTAGQVLTMNAGATAPEWATAAGGGGLTLGTPQNTTSGSTITFSSIPAGVKQITLSWRDGSTNGTGQIYVQIGDSGGLETSGYTGGTLTFLSTPNILRTAWSSGALLQNNNDTALVFQSMITLVLADASTNTWQISISTTANNGASSGFSGPGNGYKSLSATLDRIALITANTFDAGSVNIAYSS